MTIQVVSNADLLAGNSPAVAAPEEAKPEPVAPAAAELKESAASEPVEPEAKEADESEDDGDEPAAKDDEKDKPKKKSGSQRQKERAERAEAEVARMRKLVEDLALKGAGESKPEAKEPEARPIDPNDPEPDENNFETAKEYFKALAKWEVRQERKADLAASLAESQKSEQQKANEAHVARIKSFSEATPDFDDVTKALGSIQFSPTVHQAVVTSDIGPALMYALAKDPDEAARIGALPPVAALKAIGRLEAQIEAASKASDEKKTEPKKPTLAPKPVTPVGGQGGAVEKTIYDPNLTQAEFEAAERARMKRKAASW